MIREGAACGLEGGLDPDFIDYDFSLDGVIS